LRNPDRAIKEDGAFDRFKHAPNTRSTWVDGWHTGRWTLKEVGGKQRLYLLFTNQRWEAYEEGEKGIWNSTRDKKTLKTPGTAKSSTGKEPKKARTGKPKPSKPSDAKRGDGESKFVGLWAAIDHPFSNNETRRLKPDGTLELLWGGRPVYSAGKNHFADFRWEETPDGKLVIISPDKKKSVWKAVDEDTLTYQPKESTFIIEPKGMSRVKEVQEGEEPTSRSALGKWEFSYKGMERRFSFTEDNEFTGHYPVSGKQFRGTWRLNGKTVLLNLEGEPGVWGKVILNSASTAKFSQGRYQMDGTKGAAK